MEAEILATLSRIRPENDYAVAVNFIEEGLLDSFDIVMLVAELEKMFSVSIDGVDILPENFQSLSAIRELLLRSEAKA
ncbi:MAG: phosphopantetheine-binding protein [Planctomyces sp.]